MSDETFERAARRLWSTFEREGLDAMLELAGDEVTWEPLSGRGERIASADGLRRHYAEMERSGRSSSATAYRFEEIGSCVVVTGSLRELDVTGLRDSQPTWVYFFDPDSRRLRRAKGFRTRAEALAAIEQDCGSATGI